MTSRLIKLRVKYFRLYWKGSLDCGGKLHEGQAGFHVGRSCMDNAYMKLCRVD